MDVWPATLPEFGAGTSIQDDESRLTSSMDAGPASVRNRFTAITKSVKTSMVMTGAQIAIFNTFMRTTLKFGSLSFTWVNPVTGASETVRFKNNPEVIIHSYIKLETRYIPDNYDVDEFEIVDILMNNTYNSEVYRYVKLAPFRRKRTA